MTGLEILEQESETRILSKVEKNERLEAKVITKCREREKKKKKKSRENKGTNKWGFWACNASGQITVRSRCREREGKKP